MGVENKVHLRLGSIDSDNVSAYNSLVNAGVEVVIVGDPIFIRQHLAEYFPMPWIDHGRNTLRHYGLNAIQSYLDNLEN